MRSTTLYVLAVLLLAIPLSAAAQEEPPPAELAALLPTTGAFEGLAMQGEPRFFPEERLADHINGDAETYYTYGVGTTAAVRYSDGARGMLDLDIYDMLTPLGAFGVYAQRRPSEPEYLDLGTESYVSGSQVVCLTGQYYVVVKSISRSADGIEQAKKLAGLVAEASPGPDALPAELAWFPVEGLRPGSYGHSPRSFLGMDGMPPLFTALYANPEDEDDEITLAFHLFDSEEDLEAALEPMRDTLLGRLADGGQAVEYTVDLDDATAAVTAYDVKYRGQVHVARAGRGLMVAVRAAQEWAEESFAALAERIEEDGPGLEAEE